MNEQTTDRLGFPIDPARERLITDFTSTISEHPDAPVVVVVNEKASLANYDWTVCTDNTSVEMGECLIPAVAPQPREEWVYMSRDELWEDVRDECYRDTDLMDLTGADFDAEVEHRMQAFESFWRDCIVIRVH